MRTAPGSMSSCGKICVDTTILAELRSESFGVAGPEALLALDIAAVGRRDSFDSPYVRRPSFSHC